MPLFRTGFDTKGFYPEPVFYPNGFNSKRSVSEIRNKNLSDPKPFGSKNFMMSKNSSNLSYSPGFSPIAMVAYGSYFP